MQGKKKGWLTPEVLERAGRRKDFIVTQLRGAESTFQMFLNEGEYLADDDNFAVHLLYEVHQGKLVQVISGPMMHGHVLMKSPSPNPDLPGGISIKNHFLLLYQQGKIDFQVRPTRGDHREFIVIDCKEGWFLGGKPKGIARSFERESRPQKMTERQVAKALAFFSETISQSRHAEIHEAPWLMPDGYLHELGDYLERKGVDYSELTAAEIKAAADLFGVKDFLSCQKLPLEHY